VDTPSTLPTALPTPPPANLDGAGPDNPGDPNASGPNGSGGGGGPDGGHGRGSGEGSGEGPVLVTGDMVKPVLLEKIEPIYPEVARRAGLGGRVTIRAIIGLDGNVESAEVFASRNPLFDQAALDAVREWRYRPATMNGAPVRVYFTVVVDFLVR
jgi:protein TonB